MTRPNLDEMRAAAETGWSATIYLIGLMLWADRWVYLAAFAITVAVVIITRTTA